MDSVQALAFDAMGDLTAAQAKLRQLVAGHDVVPALGQLQNRLIGPWASPSVPP